MADLHKLTVQESLNAMGPGGKWDTIAAATHGGTGTTDTIHVDVSGYHQIGIYAHGDIYFNFHNTATNDCHASNDLRIDADTLVFIQVPSGLGKTIYFNHLGVAAVAVRIVKV